VSSIIRTLVIEKAVSESRLRSILYDR